jgi:hypothetical protein
MHFLITTLAEYQTGFWRNVALALRAKGHEASFLSFDDRSTAMLKAAGLTVHTLNDAVRHGPLPSDAAALDRIIASYGIDDLNYWLTHERFAFGLRDGVAMRAKLVAALQCADHAISDIHTRTGTLPVVVQELGGFLSVIGTHFAALHHGATHWFVEPSFFRGQLFFLEDSFAAKQPIVSVIPAQTDPAMDAYIEQTVSSGAIVIPAKDRHQYTTARRKIVNWRNARRLIEKLVDKHVHGKTQEFGHIGSHVRTHAAMLHNSWKLRRSYTPLAEANRFLYFPLHVPGDMALTLRSPQYLDQLTLIDYICRIAPADLRVAIKEHPAMVGALDADRLRALTRRYDNLIILPPTTNNYQVLRAAAAIVSINSKSGAEAGLIGKPVVVLGDAFYRRAPFAISVDKLTDLPAVLRNLTRAPQAPMPDFRPFFAAVWKQSLPGELYVDTPDNTATFAASLVTACH